MHTNVYKIYQIAMKIVRFFIIPQQELRHLLRAMPEMISCYAQKHPGMPVYAFGTEKILKSGRFLLSCKDFVRAKRNL